METVAAVSRYTC